MADGHEEPVHLRVGQLARLHVAELHGGHLARGGVQDVLHHRIPHEGDLGVLERALLHDLGAAQGIAAMHEVHLAPQPGQVERLLERGVPAPHHHDVLVLEEEAVAGGAGGHPAAHQLRLVGQTQQLGGGAGGDDHGVGLEGHVAAGDREGPAPQVDLGDVVGDHLGAEPLGLLLERLHQRRAVDALHEARVVLHQRGQHELPAGLDAREHDRAQVGAGGIDGRGVPRRPGSDDDHLPCRAHVSSWDFPCPFRWAGSAAGCGEWPGAPRGRGSRSRAAGCRSARARRRG